MFEIAFMVATFPAFARAVKAVGESHVYPWDRKVPLPAPTGFGRRPNFDTFLAVNGYRRPGPCSCVVCQVYGGDCANSLAGDALVDEYDWQWEEAEAHVARRREYYRVRMEAREAQAAHDSRVEGHSDEEPMRLFHAAIECAYYNGDDSAKDLQDEAWKKIRAMRAVTVDEVCDDCAPF
jgi:hypothetical protein